MEKRPDYSHSNNSRSQLFNFSGGPVISNINDLLAVGIGDMSSSSVNAPFYYEKSQWEGGLAANMKTPFLQFDFLYTGTGGIKFSEPDHQGLSMTADICLYRLSTRSLKDMFYDREIHLHYKQNNVENNLILNTTTKSYTASWYNVAILYYMHDHNRPSPMAENFLLDGRYFGGLSVGSFSYAMDIHSQQTHYSLFLESRPIPVGINIGTELTMGGPAIKNIMMNMGADSAFIYFAPVRSSLSGDNDLFIVQVELFGYIQFQIIKNLICKLTGIYTLHQSFARNTDYYGITFIELHKNVITTLEYIW